MTILILDPRAEDRSRIREALAGAIDGPFVEIDPTRPMPDGIFVDARLALLETDLPGGGGFDLLARLRLLRPDLPVVVVTRRVEGDRIVAAMKAGASDHVGKARLDRLPHAAREAMARQAAHCEAERASKQTQARLESALQSVGGIAHDLGNVFQSIRLAMDLLLRIPDDARRPSLLDTIVSSIARGGDLLGRMRLVARGEGSPLPTPDEAALPVGRR